MVPSSQAPPADPALGCADATWRCAADLRVDGIRLHGESKLGAHCQALRGLRLTDLAARALYPAQRETLSALLERRDRIRDATLSLIAGSEKPLHFLLNAVPRIDAKNGFRGYLGTVRVWSEVPFADVHRGELMESLRRADAARENERNLRTESELLLRALQIVIQPTPLQEKCSKLLESFGPVLAFDYAVILRRGPRARMVVAAASTPDTLGMVWPEDDRLKTALAGEAQLVEGDRVADLAKAFPEPLRAVRTALFASLRIGSEAAVLVILGEREGQFASRHLSLMRRLTLIATEAFQEDDQKSALVASSKLAAMGELLATIVHEINQPLTIISMSAANGRALLADGAPAEDVAKKLDRIEQQAQRTLKIVQSVRELAHSDRLTAEVQTVDLERALEAVETLARIGLERRKIELTITVTEPCRFVRGYASWLQQVVFNLITNARDAILDRLADQAGGPPGWIRLSTREHADRVIVQVSDNGGGIPQDIQERIFDPFFTLKEAGKGTGLGLPLCRRLITDMGGEIQVRNDRDGATFEISLPRAARGDGAVGWPTGAGCSLNEGRVAAS